MNVKGYRCAFHHVNRVVMDLFYEREGVSDGHWMPSTIRKQIHNHFDNNFVVGTCCKDNRMERCSGLVDFREAIQSDRRMRGSVGVRTLKSNSLFSFCKRWLFFLIVGSD